MEEPYIIYIPDEEGNEEEFEIVFQFELDTGKTYIFITPHPDNESGECYAFRYQENGDDLQLYTIEDEQEWEIVEKTFEALLEEYGEESGE